MENIRRTSEIGKLFVEGRCNHLLFGKPNKKMKEKAKSIIGTSDFYEIYISTNLEECKKRTKRSLKKQSKAKSKLYSISLYEKPVSPNLIVSTENISSEESSEILYNFVLPLIIKS